MIKGIYCDKELCQLLDKHGIVASSIRQFEHGGSWYNKYTMDVARRWLRKGHSIVIEIKVKHNTGLGGLPLFEYQWCVYHGLESNLDKGHFFEDYDECVGDALMYCMEKLF